jgi:hypothetical protein
MTPMNGTTHLDRITNRVLINQLTQKVFRNRAMSLTRCQFNTLHTLTFSHDRVENICEISSRLECENLTVEAHVYPSTPPTGSYESTLFLGYMM